MNIRHPVVAGAFYEGSASSCEHHAQRLLGAVKLPATLPQTLYGGLVPHAGWAYSGLLAATTFQALAQQRPLETVVLLGADHTGSMRQGEVFDSGVWRTPLGEVQVDGELARALIAADPSLRANPQAHDREHSLEVQVPLLQAINPDVKIVPIGIPPTAVATAIGRVIGRVLAQKFPRAVVIGSTDLTHHGGHFGSPGGRGRTGAAWTAANDRRMLDLIEAMNADEVIREADEHLNACGAGAIAATIAATRELGAAKGITLEYTNSYQIVHARYPDDPDDTTVGYASVVFA
jgi:AmmeMemoRadiSam system protein B